MKRPKPLDAKSLDGINLRKLPVELALAIAQHPVKVSPEIINALATLASVRRSAEGEDWAPVLEALGNRKDNVGYPFRDVAMALVKNPSTPKSVITRLTSYPDIGISKPAFIVSMMK